MSSTGRTFTLEIGGDGSPPEQFLGKVVAVSYAGINAPKPYVSVMVEFVVTQALTVSHWFDIAPVATNEESLFQEWTNMNDVLEVEYLD